MRQSYINTNPLAEMYFKNRFDSNILQKENNPEVLPQICTIDPSNLHYDITCHCILKALQLAEHYRCFLICFESNEPT